MAVPLLQIAETQGTACDSVLETRETLRNFPQRRAEYFLRHTRPPAAAARHAEFPGRRSNDVIGADTAALDCESSTMHARQEGIMTSTLADTVPVEEPLARLERDLIANYVARAGEDLHDLRTRTDGVARNLMAAASRYASARLTEIEARFRYLHSLHGHA